MSVRALLVDSPALGRARVPLALAGVALVVSLAKTIAVWAVIFPSGVLDPIEDATAELVTSTAIVTGLELGILLALAGCWSLAPRDLGLTCADLRRAIAPALAIWLGAQAITFVGALASGTLALGASWHAPPATIAGDFLAQLAASTLAEEVLFRAVVLVAVVHAVGRTPRGVAAAIAVSTVVFTASHFPRHVAVGLDAVAWTQATVGHVQMGVFFAIAFLVTGNLWLTAAVHTLVNMRLSLALAPPAFEESSVAVATIAYLVISARARARTSSG